jgi:hypothetical protein
MFNSSFFKFLITFAVMIGASFLVMGIAADFDTRMNTNTSTPTIILK